jgi:hypothetical protein
VHGRDTKALPDERGSITDCPDLNATRRQETPPTLLPSAFLMHGGLLLSVPIAFFLQGIYDLIEVSIWPGKLENRAKQGIII